MAQESRSPRQVIVFFPRNLSGIIRGNMYNTDWKLINCTDSFGMQIFDQDRQRDK
jgi:hypothetical protein